MLRLAGAEVWRVGFNAGDRAFWFHPASYIPYRGKADAWKDTFVGLLADKGVTDIVLYGDTRPIHAQAVAEAKARGLEPCMCSRKVICGPTGSPMNAADQTAIHG